MRACNGFAIPRGGEVSVIYLIHYDRVSSILVSIKEFSEVDRALATKERVDLEIALCAQGLQQEVVLLEAESEDVLRTTHRRYFETLDQLRKSDPPKASKR